MIILIQFVHLLILSLLKFSVPPEFFIYPYLIAKNWLPYAQIIDQHFPGIFLLPPGLTPQFYQLVLLLIVLSQSFWIYKISQSRLAVAFFAVWQPFFSGSHLWIDTLLPLFTLPALYLFSSHVFLSGFLLGMALVFKQSVIVLILVALLFSPKKLRFLISSFLPISLVIIYFWNRGVLADFYFWTIKFNFQVYPVLARLWPTAKDLIKLSFPAVLFLIAFIKSKNRLLQLFAFFSLTGLVPRFDFIHFQPAIPFIVILLSQLKANKLVLLISIVWVAFFLRHQFGPGQYQYFDQQTFILASQIHKLTTSGESIFILGAQPHLYVLSDTVPSGSLFSFSLPWYLPLLENRLLAFFPKLVVVDQGSSVDGRPLSSYAPTLLNYIQSNYQPIYQIGTVTVYENRI